MSKVVKCAVDIKNVDRSILDEAIKYLRQYDRVILLQSDQNEILLRFAKYGMFGDVRIQLSDGQMTIYADRMHMDEIRGLIKQKYLTAYIARKTKARVKYDENTREMLLEVPI